MKIDVRKAISLKAQLTTLLLGSAMFSIHGHCAPDSYPDPNATTVYLRKSCAIAKAGAAGLETTTLENCFETTPSLKNWIYTNSTNSEALLIDVGPGSFGPFVCSGVSGGRLSFRGSGAGKTIFSVIKNYQCADADWSFSDLTVSPAGNENVVEWLAAGTSSWRNVVLEGKGGTSWYDAGGSNGNGDQPCLDGEQGIHRFHSVRFITHAATKLTQGGLTGFLNRCGDNWLWGSEIVFTPDPASQIGDGSAIVSEGTGSKIHVYGGNIRAEAASSAASGEIRALYVRDGAEVHTHGIGIDVVANPGMTATALDAGTNGEIHANESSYFMPSQTGVVLRRVINDGTAHIHAPFNWGPHLEAPNITSVTGADTAIVTNTTDGRPRMVIYQSNCNGNGGGKNWFDPISNTCR